MTPEPTAAGRIFVAAPLADDVRQTISQHLDRSLHGRALPGRVVAQANWHLTLRFLGDTSAARLRALLDRLASTDLGQACSLAFTSLGAFPRPDRARVLWLGTGDGAPQLAALAIVAVAAGAFDDLTVFDALESGLLLVVAWGALRAIADFIADWRVVRRDHPAGTRGWVGTLKAVSLRQDAEGE